jgi:septum formation protein
MNHAMNFEEFLRMTEGKVKVLVSEIPTMLAWLDEAHHDQREWGELRNVFMQRLAPHFPVVFLRTSDYSHEIIITPNGYKGPNRLDYADLAPEKKIGYGDRLTAEHLHDFLSPRILLASESPRRLALLQQILPRNKVQVAVSGLAEDQVENENPIDRVTRLAQEKALKTWEDFRKLPENSDKHNIQIVIGADTEIVLDGKTVMHPTSDRQAKEILSSLSGKEVTAITGYCLLHTRTYTETNTDEVITSHAETQLKIKELTTAEIDQYVQSGEPIGKAGAFGIQGKGALLIERIKGSYSNVVGLPLEQLAKELNDIGTSIWVLDEVSNWTFPTKGKK